MGDSWAEAFDLVIPQWDGRAESIRQHKEDVSWWLAGVDLSKTASFNLAACYVRRQQHPGVAARLRALKPTRENPSARAITLCPGSPGSI